MNLDQFAESCLDAVLKRYRSVIQDKNRFNYYVSKLTQDQKEKIIEQYDSGMTILEVAENHHVGKSTIGTIVKGRRSASDAVKRSIAKRRLVL